MLACELPEEFEYRLREWGRFFADHRKPMRCASAEKDYRRRSGDWAEDDGAPPQEHHGIRDGFAMDRVEDTHRAIQTQDAVAKWALTFAYCYRHYEKGRVLAIMRKMTGRRLGWYAYLDTLDAAKIRLYCLLSARV